MRSELCNEPQNLLEHLPCRLPEGRSRRQRPREITEIIAQRMKLEPDGIGGVPNWWWDGVRQIPRPLDRALAFFNQLLACATASHPSYLQATLLAQPSVRLAHHSILRSKPICYDNKPKSHLL
jgi:hypothetical protein